MSKRSYSDEEKAAALLALQANGGNLSRTARETGVPIATLAHWRDDAPAWVTDIAKEKRLPLADRLEELAHLMIDAVPAKIAATGTRDLVFSTAIAVDKAQLLRGQPTTITRTEEPTDSERVEGALALFDAARARRAGPADPPAVH